MTFLTADSISGTFQHMTSDQFADKHTIISTFYGNSEGELLWAQIY